MEGSYTEACFILKACKKFLSSILKFDLELLKTKIISLHINRILFLGFELFRGNNYYAIMRKRKKAATLRLHAPISTIIQKLRAEGFVKGYKGIPNFRLISKSKDQIIIIYNSIFNKIHNYYCISDNYVHLRSILKFLLRESCIKLLATKFKLKTQRQVIRKFGSSLGNKYKNSVIRLFNV